MPAGSPADDPPPQLSGEWRLDAEPAGGEDPVVEPGADAPRAPESAQPRSHHLPLTAHHQDDVPPSPEQLVEAMLFVGGAPLSAATACSAVRGLTPDRFLVAVDSLSRMYRRERRPYTILARDGGFVLAVLPSYRSVRDRLFGGPREARLSQPALDVLSVVAYRQPVGKPEVDAVRGTDSAATLRLLVRLGLVAVQHRAEAGARAVRYGTTPRFLQLFNLSSLDELPRLGDTSQV